MNFFSGIFSTIAVIIFGSLVEKSDLNLPEESPDLQLKVGWSYVLACLVTAAHLLCPLFGALEYSKLTVNPPLSYSPPIPMVRLHSEQTDVAHITQGPEICNGNI